MDSGWSNGHLCKYDKTQSSGFSVYSWDPHPGLEHSGPASMRGNNSSDIMWNEMSSEQQHKIIYSYNKN